MTEDALESCAEVFKAMGDKTRLTILRNLFRGEMCVTELARALKMDAPRVSFHLTRLKFARLVVDERQGQRVIYRINPALVESDGKEEIRLRLSGGTISFNRRTW